MVPYTVLSRFVAKLSLCIRRHFKQRVSFCGQGGNRLAANMSLHTVVRNCQMLLPSRVCLWGTSYQENHLCVCVCVCVCACMCVRVCMCVCALVLTSLNPMPVVVWLLTWYPFPPLSFDRNSLSSPVTLKSHLG